uniref:Uncharacterized protein n=1 Tax=Clastoptera arizonana TaxID=38151 RepID=A0A1B6DX48_9HEMI
MLEQNNLKDMTSFNSALHNVRNQATRKLSIQDWLNGNNFSETANHLEQLVVYADVHNSTQEFVKPSQSEIDEEFVSVSQVMKNKKVTTLSPQKNKCYNNKSINFDAIEPYCSSDLHEGTFINDTFDNLFNKGKKIKHVIKKTYPAKVKGKATRKPIQSDCQVFSLAGRKNTNQNSNLNSGENLYSVESGELWTPVNIERKNKSIVLNTSHKICNKYRYNRINKAFKSIKNKRKLIAKNTLTEADKHKTCIFNSHVLRKLDANSNSNKEQRFPKNEYTAINNTCVIPQPNNKNAISVSYNSENKNNINTPIDVNYKFKDILNNMPIVLVEKLNISKMSSINSNLIINDSKDTQKNNLKDKQKKFKGIITNKKRNMRVKTSSHKMKPKCIDSNYNKEESNCIDSNQDDQLCNEKRDKLIKSYECPSIAVINSSTSKTNMSTKTDDENLQTIKKCKCNLEVGSKMLCRFNPVVILKRQSVADMINQFSKNKSYYKPSSNLIKNNLKSDVLKKKTYNEKVSCGLVPKLKIPGTKINFNIKRKKECQGNEVDLEFVKKNQKTVQPLENINLKSKEKNKLSSLVIKRHYTTRKRREVTLSKSYNTNVDFFPRKKMLVTQTKICEQNSFGWNSLEKTKQDFNEAQKPRLDITLNVINKQTYISNIEGSTWKLPKSSFTNPVGISNHSIESFNKDAEYKNKESINNLKKLNEQISNKRMYNSIDYGNCILKTKKKLLSNHIMKNIKADKKIICKSQNFDLCRKTYVWPPLGNQGISTYFLISYVYGNFLYFMETFNKRIYID